MITYNLVNFGSRQFLKLYNQIIPIGIFRMQPQAPSSRTPRAASAVCPYYKRQFSTYMNRFDTQESPMTCNCPDVQTQLNKLRKTVRRLLIIGGAIIIWLIGQVFELNSALAGKIEITKTTLRGAARDNTLNITYEHPSLIGPWWFWVPVCLIVVYIVFRALRRWWHRGNV